MSRDREVGVDVEDRTRGGDLLDVADRFFSPFEVKALTALPTAEQMDRFFLYWTLKESYIKARGMGLSTLTLRVLVRARLTQRTVSASSSTPVSSDDPERWRFSVMSYGRRHAIAAGVESKRGADVSDRAAGDGAFTGKADGPGKNLPEVGVDTRVRIPVARVAERHFLEPDAVDPVGRAYVEMSRDHHLGAKPEVPVLGALGAAPDREARDAPEADQLFPQREVIDENHGQGAGLPLESLFSASSHRAAHQASMLSWGRGSRKRSSAQTMPVSAAQAIARSRLTCCRPKAVVVEKEQRRQHRGASLALPDHVGILRRQDAVAPAERDQGLVLLDPSRPVVPFVQSS